MHRNTTALLFALGLLAGPHGILIAAPVSWTDPTLTPNVTSIREVHITQLRTEINNKRAAVALAAFSWTDPVITANSSMIRAVHITEMRTAIGQVYTAQGRAVPSWTDPVITATITNIRAVHIQELRNAVDAAPSLAEAACATGGGAWVSGPDICYFSGSSCPAGWSQSASYSSTIAKLCYTPGIVCSSTVGAIWPCTTGSHSRSNTGIESCSWAEWHRA